MLTNSVSFNQTRLRLLLFWVTGFIAIAVIGGALTIDLTGFSAADRFMVARWGFRGLRLYLWFEAGVVVSIIPATGRGGGPPGARHPPGGGAGLPWNPASRSPPGSPPPGFPRWF